MPPRKRRALGSPPRGPHSVDSPSLSSTHDTIPTHFKPFTCVIAGCTSQFGAEGEAVPHRLSCGDVVCGGCWSAAQCVGNCPVCGLGGAKLEFVDEALSIVGKSRLGLGSKSARASVLCFDCKRDDDDIEATHICSCGSEGTPICDEHVSLHKRRGHDPAPLASSAVDRCPHHRDRKSELMCNSDRTMLCALCVPDHKGHDIVTLDASLSLLQPELATALDSLRNQSLTTTGYIETINAELVELFDMVADSEAAVQATVHSLHAAIDDHIASRIRDLHAARSTRETALNTQSDVIQRGLCQMQDAMSLAEEALEGRNPSLMVSTLKTLSLVSRIPARNFHVRYEDTVLSLDVDTGALLELLPHCSSLRLRVDEPLRTAARMSSLQDELRIANERNRELTADLSSAKRREQELREQSSALEEKLAGVTQHAAVNLQKWKDAVSELEKRPSMNSVVKDAATIKTLQWQLASLAEAKIMEAAAIAECKRVGAAAKTAVLSRADANALIRLGSSPISNANIAAAFCDAMRCASRIDDNCVLLGSPAVDAIIDVMRAYPSNVHVQSTCCGALWNMNGGKLGCTNVSHSISVGAMDSVNSAWSVIGDDPHRKYLAVGAIGMLVTTTSIQSILDAGWLNRVLTFMEERQDGGNDQHTCCQTLWLFASLPVGKAAVLADARSVPYLLRARDRHPGDNGAQKFSTKAFEALAAPG